MLLSYVLRLVPSALDEGRLVGTVQTVETGQTTPFGSAEELIAALRAQPGEPDSAVTIDLRDKARLRAADTAEGGP